MTIDFVRHSRKAYLFSVILLIAGAISLIVSGLNLGIDFTGGTVFHLNLQEDFTVQEVKDVLTPFEMQGLPIQTVQGRNLQGEIINTGVAIKSPYLDE
ncbi:MAG: protein translocase subunit SecF, partial [Firmicutes bacterium]|nr:protein translocase subunit SecF [Bacillota bacterium]